MIQFRALGEQFDLEDLSASPVTSKVLKIASLIPLAWPFEKIAETLKGRLAADSIERIRLLLQTCIQETRAHAKDVEQLRYVSGCPGNRPVVCLKSFDHVHHDRV
jgi:hypothetical protein